MVYIGLSLEMENVGILGSSVTIFEFEKKRNKMKISFRMFCLQTKFYQQPKFLTTCSSMWMLPFAENNIQLSPEGEVDI